MNNREARQIIDFSLTERGAVCKPEGASIIVARWKTTVWRIFVDTSEEVNINSNKEIEVFSHETPKNNQQVVIARIYTDGHIEYRKSENGKIIRPRCLVKGKKTKIVKKEFHE